MHTDFRHVLRTETRRDHDVVDGRISEFNLTTSAGFSAFARIHLHCFRSMMFSAQVGSWSLGQLCAMVADLEKDISILDENNDTNAPEDLGAIEPLALDYMVAGSRLGSQVLRRRWAQSCEPKVVRASHYFGAVNTADAWQKTCAQLSAIDPDSRRAKDITSDTGRLFRFFAETCATHAPKISALET